MKANPTVQTGASEAPTVRDSGYVRPGQRKWISRTLSKFSPERRRAVERYLEHLELNGRSGNTVERYIQSIRTLGNDGKSYEELTREDIIDWMRRLPSTRRDGRNGGKYSKESVNSMKGFVKHFLKWLHNGDDQEKPLPEHLRCIHVQKPKPSLRKEVLTQDEVRELVDVVEKQRDRALIFVGYESGCRAGELVNLRIRDVRLDEYGAVLLVSGKTGERRIRVVNSVPDLQLWLNMHPMYENPDAPLWPSREGNHSAITVARFHGMLRRYAKLANIKKHIHPHLLRHSRATHLATVLKEAQMREFFGWTKTSDMPSVYVHLSGRDVDKTLLEHYGIDTEEKRAEDEVLKPTECARCGLKNPAGMKFCGRCSAVIDIKTAIDLEQKRGVADEITTQVMQEFIRQAPDLLQRILEETGAKQKIAQLQANGGV